MIRILFLLVISFALSLNFAEAQMTINEDTVIKDENGKTISYGKFGTLMSSGKYILIEKEDKNGSYIQLKKASKEQKEMMLKMMMSQDKADRTGEDAPNFEFTDISGIAYLQNLQKEKS